MYPFPLKQAKQNRTEVFKNMLNIVFFFSFKKSLSTPLHFLEEALVYFD